MSAMRIARFRGGVALRDRDAAPIMILFYANRYAPRSRLRQALKITPERWRTLIQHACSRAALSRQTIIYVDAAA